VKSIYLSHFLGTDTPFYGGDGSFQVEQLRSMTAGDNCNSCRWAFPNHAGTHIDLPRHFVPGGRCLDDYPPGFWIFRNSVVIDISTVVPRSIIVSGMLDKARVSASVELLMLKTGFGKFRNSLTYWKENPVFIPELADYLRTRFPSLRVFGFDTISISSWTDRKTGREAHRAFLGGERPILLIEDMNLEAVEESMLFPMVTVAPILVAGADAAPCTVIAEVVK
jgi:arylformamidase